MLNAVSGETRSRQRRGSSAITRKREALRQRAATLRSEAIEFIASAEFTTEQSAGESNDSLLAALLGRACEPPRDLPSHLARLCEVDLLSAEDERTMFRSMNYLKFRAHALCAALDGDCPDEATVREAERLLDGAKRIRDQLIQANMRLAISVVKKFVSPQRSFDDMLSDGIFSLMQAVDKFDFERGFRFSTYAYRAIARNAYRKMQEARKESVRLVNDGEEVYEVASEGSGPSLDERTWELLRGTLGSLMERLDRRERFIVRSRYALGSHRKVKTFQNLADKLGLSKERVRQLEQRAVAKLRRWSAEAQVFA